MDAVISGARKKVSVSITGSAVLASPYVIAAAVASVYLLTMTQDYFWDGITFALQIEKVARGERGNEMLFHQNHLLYNAFGYVAYRIARAASSGIRALTVLGIANVCIGSASIGVFYNIANRVTRNRYAAIVCSTALAFSATWWKLATDADAYMLSVLLILICFNNLQSERSRWYLAGLSLSGAMLIHELASLFSIAAIVAIFSNPTIQRKTRFAAAMCGLAWSIAIGAYYICAAMLHGLTRPLDVIRWATSNPSLIELSSNPIPGIILTPRSNLDIVVGHSFTLFRQQGGIGWVIAASVIISAFAFFASFVRTVRPNALVNCLRRQAPEVADSWEQNFPVVIVWVSVYLVFLCFFEPQDPNLRLFYAPALALGLGLIVSNYGFLAPRNLGFGSSKLSPSRTALLAVTTLALFNFAFFIKPHMRMESNRMVTAASGASKVWNERTVVFYANHNEADSTFEYFNEQTEWRRLIFAPESIRSQIRDLHKEGKCVWLNTAAAGKLNGNLLAEYVRGREIRVDVDHAPAHYIEVLPRQ